MKPFKESVKIKKSFRYRFSLTLVRVVMAVVVEEVVRAHPVVHGEQEQEQGEGRAGKCKFVQMKGEGAGEGEGCSKGGMSCERKCSYSTGETTCEQVAPFKR